MISSIAWVPKGVADPSPKKYELSSAEQELVRMMEAQGLTEGDGDETEQNAEEEIEEEEEDEEEEKVSPTKKNKKKEETPHHGLPADLRMDEYSSDEDENDEAVQGVALGSLLMEKEEEASEEDPEKDTGNNDEKMGSDSSDDDDDDDDLDDIPDTREYEPINVEGLESMGFSQVGSNAPMYMDGDEEFDDDDSEADDVRLNENDAIIVVAKTEEVSDRGFMVPNNWKNCSVLSRLNKKFYRILLRWKFMFMSSILVICSCITMFHCRHFRCVWPTVTLVHRDRLVIFVLSECFPLVLKFGILTY